MAKSKQPVRRHIEDLTKHTATCRAAAESVQKLPVETLKTADGKPARIIAHGKKPAGD